LGQKNGYILILTRDEDFAQLQNLKGHPPKIVILRIQNRTTQYVATLIEKHFDDLLDLAHNDALGLLEIFET
jgi:predicted nuclease of predicted toxin-antitoxin system